MVSFLTYSTMDKIFQPHYLSHHFFFEWIYECMGVKFKIISSLFSNFKGSEQESKGLPCKKGIVQSVVGQGYHRKIILASQSMQNTMYRSVLTTPHKSTQEPINYTHNSSITEFCQFKLSGSTVWNRKWLAKAVFVLQHLSLHTIT